MKNYILPVVILVVMTSCQKEDPQPVKEELFSGSWNYTGINLEMNFDASKSSDGYTFSNINVEYSEIPSSENVTYEMEARDSYADGDGFALIRIIGSWTTTCPNGMICDKWIFIDLRDNKIYENGEKMNVRDIEILMVDREPIIIQDQMFTKN